MGYPALFIAVLAMSIMLLYGSPSSLNPDKYRQQGDVVQLVSIVNALVMDIATYEMTMQKRIDPNTWYDELRSNDASVPRSTQLREWSMGSSSDQRYLCIHQPSNPTSYQLELFQKAQQQIDHPAILNNDCGAADNWDGVTPLEKISLTIYFKG